MTMKECMLRWSAAHMAASMSTELPVGGNWACMKQVVLQAVLASLAEVAAREQGPGNSCSLAEVDVCKTLPHKLCVCLFRHCHACWWRAWRTPGRTTRLFSGYPPPPPPCLPSNSLHTFSAVGPRRSARP